MTPDENLQALVSMTGNTRQEIADLLGYRNESSIRQCLRGRAALPEKKLNWLRVYAAYRSHQNDKLIRWLATNPPPREWKEEAT